jgi:ribonuclease D
MMMPDLSPCTNSENDQDSPFTVTPEEILILPQGGFPGQIHWIPDEAAMHSIWPFLKGEHLLGFDTETKPTFKKGQKHPIALIQLSAEKHAFIFPIHRTGIFPGLREILEDEKIQKIAQEPDQEIKKLMDEHAVQVKNIFNLGIPAKQWNCSPKSIRGLTAIFLGIRITKSSQRSNWSKFPLTQKQLRYAATDAWVCRQIYLAMKDRDLIV